MMTWISLADIMLNGINQAHTHTKKNKYCMTSYEKCRKKESCRREGKGGWITRNTAKRLCNLS